MKRKALNGFSETAKGHSPMPANVDELIKLCLAEAKLRVSVSDVAHPRYLRDGVRAWATMALATAISAKHASAALGMNRNYAAYVRIMYVRFAEAADAFGETLAVQWLDEVA